MSVLMRTTHSTHIEHMTRPLWHSHSACGCCLQMQTEGQAGVEVINQDGQLFVSGADGWREVVVATKADLADWADYVTDLALQGLVCASCAVCHVFQARACVLCEFVGLSVVTVALGAQGGGGDGTGGRGVRGRHRLHRWFGVSRVSLVIWRSVCMHARFMCLFQASRRHFSLWGWCILPSCAPAPPFTGRPSMGDGTGTQGCDAHS